MATIFEKDTVKRFALEHAGEVFKFYDGNKMIPTMMGRVVGYYFTMALLVMETDEKPELPIDPIMGSLSHNGIPLTKGSFYTLCSLNELVIDKDEIEEKSYFPHTCPCGARALIMFKTIECSSSSCKNYTKS